MGFRHITTDPFQFAMTRPNAAPAMNSATSKGMSNWVNKDIREAVEKNDWSELIAKAQKQTKYFRNSFYK